MEPPESRPTKDYGRTSPTQYVLIKKSKAITKKIYSCGPLDILDQIYENFPIEYESKFSFFRFGKYHKGVNIPSLKLESWDKIWGSLEQD